MKLAIRIGCLFGVMGMSLAWGADGTWTGAADGAWSDTANWQGGTVASGAGSAAYLSNLSGPIQITNDVAGLSLEVLRCYGGDYSLIGEPLTFAGSAVAPAPYGLFVDGGALTLGSAFRPNRSMPVTVASGSTLTTTGEFKYLGNYTVEKRSAGEWVFAGFCAITNASVRLDTVGGVFRLAPGAVFTSLGGDREQFRVGFNGTSGRVVVESGAELNLPAFVLGHDTAAAKGYMLVDGGKLTANMTGTSNPLLVGRWATGTLCASNNATITITDWFNLGVYTRGELYIGGNSTMTSGRFSLGWHTQEASNFNGPGVVTLGSGVLSVLNQFVWRSSGVASRTNLVTVGNGTPGSATLRLPATMRTTSKNGSARLTLNGGKLEMIGLRTTTYASLTNYLYGLEEFWLGRAGGTLDTGTNTITLTQTIGRDPSVLRDGGLVKVGAGVLTLKGDCTYSGPTVLVEGTLRLAGALPAGALTVGPGATLDCSDGQLRAFAPSSVTAGQGGESVFALEAGAGSTCDSIVLGSGSQLGDVQVQLVGLGGTGPYWVVGDYVVASYSGSDPNVSGWRANAPLGLSVTFEVQPAQKQVVMHVSGVDLGYSAWIAPGGGAWGDAENWNILPVSGPATAVRFGGAIGGAAAIALGAPVTVGRMTFDTPFACSLGGSGMTFGAGGSGGTIEVAQGSHALNCAVTLPANLSVVAQPGALVNFGGGVTGSGRVTVTGGGTLAITNGAAFDVPVTVDGAALGATASTTLDSALTVGSGGATLNPSYGKTLTLAGTLDGSGVLTKDGSNLVVIEGSNTGTGDVTVQNGTLELSTLTEGGGLVLGDGRLRYTGTNAVVDKGFTVRTSNAKLGATFETDANVTFNGNIVSERGVFVKAGSGTLTFAAPGVNTLGTGLGSDNYSAVMNFGPYGESPTTGLRVFNVINGKVVMGLPGQTNLMNNQTVIIGGQSTTSPGAETAGHLEINGGYVQCGIITIGRGNGTPTTAPVPLESSVTLNDGTVQCGGLWFAARLNDMATVNAKPIFTMNGGVLIGSQLFCGNTTCTINPRLYFNGGFAAFTGSAADDVRLGYAGGVTSETFVAGGTLAISNTTIRLAENNSTAKGVLHLDGGRVITRGINRQGSGRGEVYLNGGVLEACQDLTLTNLSAAVVQAGGFVAEVPAGLTLTLRQTLTHDAALGGTPDGGLVKLGAGTLSVDVAQSYTGPTVVSGGVLRVAGSLAASDLTFSGGTTLSLADGVEQVFAPTSFTAGGADGSVRVALEIAADGSAYDVLALPAGGGGKLTLCLIKTGTALRFISPGRYPLVTFSGAAPDTADWSVEGLEAVATFEEEGTTVYVRIGAGGDMTSSVWTHATGGAWADAGNWSAAPANDASANVLFGGAITAPATVDTGSGATFGFLVADSANAYTWDGGPLTLGAAESNATIFVVQGDHVMDADLAVPSAAQVFVGEGAGLAVNGAVTGAGSLAVSGGGAVTITNGTSVAVPLSLDGVTVTVPLSTTFDTPLTLGSGGITLVPGAAQTVEVTADVAGSGALTKTGSSILNLSGGVNFTGDLTVRNGTVSVAEEPAGAVVIGEGTLRYTGAGATFARGYTVRTTTSTQAATFDSDADITFNGQVTAERGTFIKLGSGILTYAYGGENILSAGDNIANGGTYLNLQPYGDTPTQGYRSYNVYNGTVVLGAAGQTNRFSQAVIIGGESTTNGEAETAGHMVINGGVNFFADYVTVGRGNGTETTAPTGLVSTLTVNGGDSLANGFWMAAKLVDEPTLTARPRLTMNDGMLNTTTFLCGNIGGTPRPEIIVNGGTLIVGPNDALKLANCAGCETEMSINGGSVIVTNQSLRLAENITGARGVLNLNGGRLVAQTLTLGGASGTGIVNFNGGVFQPTLTTSMNALLVLTNQAGGAVFDVPAGIVYTVGAALNHDEALGATPDGGVVKRGAGTLVLAGTQGYTGATVVSNGSLEVTGTLPVDAELIAEPEGTLVLTAPVDASLEVGSLSLGSASGAEAGLTLTADPGRFESGGALAVSGDLFLGKTAVTILPRGASIAEVTNGTYVVMTCAGTISGSADDLRVANGIFGKGYTFSVSGNEVLLTVAMATSNAAIWSSAAGGDWSEAGNWITAPGAGGVGMTIGFGQAITAPATVNLDDAVTAGSLLFNNTSRYTLSGSGSLSFAVSNGNAEITVEQGAHTVAVAAALDSGLTATPVAGAELALTGAVTGSGTLTKAGDGTLALSGNNTFAGGTEAEAGTLDVSGPSPLGTGGVLFNGGKLSANGGAPATLANDLTVNAYLTIDTAQPLTFAGDWTATGHSLITKTGSNELTVAGSMQPAGGIAERLEIKNGSVRFASGADALFTSAATRNSIDFGNADTGVTLRQMSIESGASVSAPCLYFGFGVTNILSVSGGSLSLTGYPDTYKDCMVGGGGNTTIMDYYLFSGGSVYAADDAWWIMGAWSTSRSVMNISGGTVSIGLLSLGNRDLADYLGDYGSADVTVSGGLLEVRKRWNWMGDSNGTRLNTVWLNGGRLRMPATFSSNVTKINQSRLIFNGGTLETPGGGLDAEVLGNYLAGLKQAYVGNGGAVVDTQGRDVTLAQRLMTLDGETGGVVKRGLGTLTLAEAPCVAGRLDAQAGTLRLTPEAGDVYPDDAMLLLTFENGVLSDDSAYAHPVYTHKGNTNNLNLVAGKYGDYALAFNSQNALYLNTSSDTAKMESYTVSAWVYKTTFTGSNPSITFFGTLDDYTATAYEFLLRTYNGAFRMLATGSDNKGFGQRIVEVTNAVPLNTWTMLTLTVNGQNGISMYVNGQKRQMRSTETGEGGPWTLSTEYGIGKTWYLTGRTSGRLCAIGTTTTSDGDYFNGTLDDVAIYRRALSATEIATLYTASNPYENAKRVRAAAGATIDLAGAAQELSEVTGEGLVGNGTAVVTGTLNPGDSDESAAGALLSVANLTLATNMTYVCNWTPEANDLVDVWGTLTVNGAGSIDLGLTTPDQMPGYPRLKSFPVMYYTDISGAANFSQWSVIGIGRSGTGTVSAADGVVTVSLDVPSGTLIILK